MGGPLRQLAGEVLLSISATSAAEVVEATRGSKSIKDARDLHFKKPKERPAIAEAMPQAWEALRRDPELIVDRPSPGAVEVTGSFEDAPTRTSVYASVDLEGSNLGHVYLSKDREEGSPDAAEASDEGAEDPGE